MRQCFPNTCLWKERKGGREGGRTKGSRISTAEQLQGHFFPTKAQCLPLKAQAYLMWKVIQTPSWISNSASNYSNPNWSSSSDATNSQRCWKAEKRSWAHLGSVLCTAFHGCLMISGAYCGAQRVKVWLLSSSTTGNVCQYQAVLSCGTGLRDGSSRENCKRDTLSYLVSAPCAPI
jgi:hypothetical protein